jgi:hypothetical protein
MLTSKHVNSAPAPNMHIKHTPSIIDFPHNHDDVSLFLDFMHKRDIPTAVNFAQYERVLGLCEIYSCDIIVERIVARLHAVVTQAPWSAFCIASHLDDLALAKAALAVMEHDENIAYLEVKTITLDLASRCAMPYFLGYTRIAGGRYCAQ